MTKVDSSLGENNALEKYYKKDVNYRYKGEDLVFKVSQSLFSSQDIDLGTRRLLQSISSENIHYSKVLDLGCGYGPIGVSLKKVNYNAIIHMVDRDALAIGYSKLNSELNHVETSVYASLGYDQVIDTDYDLVIANIPAKVGEPMLKHMLDDAKYHLKANGLVAIVVIDAITEYVRSTLSSLDIEILLEKKSPGHSVFIYKFNDSVVASLDKQRSSYDRNLYFRGSKTFSYRGANFPMFTAYDLPEFDTLSYETEMVLDEISSMKDKNIKYPLVFNVNQGIIPVAISHFLRPSSLLLYDRDLLALQVTNKNLVTNNFEDSKISLHHEVDLSSNTTNIVDCVIGTFDSKEGSLIHMAYLEQATSLLSIGGYLILASGSTPITRIEKSAKRIKSISKVKRKKTKGKSLVVFKKMH